jgi:hypothetical protein
MKKIAQVVVSGNKDIKISMMKSSCLFDAAESLLERG